MAGACKRCGLPLPSLNAARYTGSSIHICEDCGQDQREPVEDDQGIDMPEDPCPERHWTPEQWEAWDRGEKAEEKMLREMRGRKREDDR